MLAVSFLGSPRKHGNTALLLEHCLQGFRAGHREAQTQEYFLHDMNIQFCRGCNYCKEAQRGCAIKDDMPAVYEKIKAASVIVVATPVYWWSMSAQMKGLLDRLYAMDFEREMQGKKLALLLTYGGELPNSGPDLVEKTFRDICEFTGINFIGVCGACTDEYMPVAENKKAQEQAYALGKYL